MGLNFVKYVVGVERLNLLVRCIPRRLCTAPPVGISGMGEVVLSPGAVVMVVVDGVEFEVNAIPHVVEVGNVSTENVDDDVFEVVGPRKEVSSTVSSVMKVSKLLVLTK
jgi:hypothetical protein